MPAEPGIAEVLTNIHDQVAVFVRQLDELMRELSADQARELVTEARHLLTVATFLRDATIDLLETAGIDIDAGEIDPLAGSSE